MTQEDEKKTIPTGKLFSKIVDGVEVSLHRDDQFSTLYDCQVGNGSKVVLGDDQDEAIEKIQGFTEVGVMTQAQAEALESAIRHHMSKLGKNFVVFISLTDDDVRQWEGVLPTTLRQKRFGDEYDARSYIESLHDELAGERLCLLIVRIHAAIDINVHEDFQILGATTPGEQIPTIILAPEGYAMHGGLHHGTNVVAGWPATTENCSTAYGIVHLQVEKMMGSCLTQR